MAVRTAQIERTASDGGRASRNPKSAISGLPDAARETPPDHPPGDAAFYRWLGASILLLAVGVTFQLGLLVYAMYALLGILVISRFLAREWVENLKAERECNRLTAEIGDTAAFIVTVRNTGRLPVPWVLLEDSLPASALQQRPPRIKIDGKRSAIFQLVPGGRKSLRFQVQFLMRGYYQIGPLLYESGDLFGLHRRYRVETDPAFVLVYPRVVPLQGYDLSSRRPVGEVRLAHRLFEDPTRIAGIREYQLGDAFNRIHWQATARTGKLHCKVYEPSCVAGATILLDFHQATHPPRFEPHRSELAVTTAASLAHAVYQLGQQIGLVTNGRDAADRVREEGYRHEFRSRATAQAVASAESQNSRLRPVIVETRRGAEQFTRILETLARAELTDGLTLAELIAESSSRLPRDATVIVILGDVAPEAALALGNLRRQGFAITAILCQPEPERFHEAAGSLVAERIDVRRIDSEAEISSVCSLQLAGLSG